MVPQRHQGMKQQIRRFEDDLVLLPTFPSNRHLAGFLDDFLQDTIDTAFQQFGRVGFTRGLTLPLLDHLVEAFENSTPGLARLCLWRVQTGKEAGPLPRMARRADRLDLQEKGIAVTIEKQVLELQPVTRGLTLFP